MSGDREQYIARKAQFDTMLTVYGRKPVLEALLDNDTRAFRLHLAESNKPASILTDIEKLAREQQAEVLLHSRQALSRISRNGKQDQGVAVDLICKGYQHYRDFLQHEKATEWDIIALDRITNPQNLGMIVRSVCAGGTRALLLPQKGCAKLDALVIKASAGTLFRANILRCHKLEDALADFRQHGAKVFALSSHADSVLGDIAPKGKHVFVLGNESEGVSDAVSQQCNHGLRIPMNRGVESLNVAVTASLLAFRHQLT